MPIREACLDPFDPELTHLRVVTLKAGSDVKVVVTCDSIYEVWTHWVGYRTLPCLGEDCPKKVHRSGSRYAGYISVVYSTRPGHEIIRLTELAAADLLRACPRGESLRGRAVQLKREGIRNNARLRAYVAPVSVETARLPAQEDLRLHLSRVWRIDGINPVELGSEYPEKVLAFYDDAKSRTAAEGVRDAV